MGELNRAIRDTEFLNSIKYTGEEIDAEDYGSSFLFWNKDFIAEYFREGNNAFEINLCFLKEDEYGDLEASTPPLVFAENLLPTKSDISSAASGFIPFEDAVKVLKKAISFISNPE